MNRVNANVPRHGALRSWYFRNALVKANYKNVAKGINQNYSFLIKFFRNLLMGENNELKNRFMLVNPPVEWVSVAEQEYDKHRTSAEQDGAFCLHCENDSRDRY